MSATLTIHDATPMGEKTHSMSLSLDDLSEQLTAREIIHARIVQEVQDYNQKKPEVFRGLVEPEGAEQQLNGVRLKERRVVDWEEQFAKAIEAFASNGFFILVDDRQMTELDEPVPVRVDSEISFVKLVPLVGG